MKTGGNNFRVPVYQAPPSPHEKKCGTSSDDDDCLVDLVSRFRYPKRTISVLMGANKNANVVDIVGTRTVKTGVNNFRVPVHQGPPHERE